MDRLIAPTRAPLSAKPEGIADNGAIYK